MLKMYTLQPSLNPPTLSSLPNDPPLACWLEFQWEPSAAPLAAAVARYTLVIAHDIQEQQTDTNRSTLSICHNCLVETQASEFTTGLTIPIKSENEVHNHILDDRACIALQAEVDISKVKLTKAYYLLCDYQHKDQGYL